MAFRATLSIFTLCGLFLICLTATTVKPKSNWGPYTTTAVGLKTCINPSRPYVKDPVVKLSVDNNGLKKRVMKGNVTIIKGIQNAKVSIKEFYYEDRKWVVTFHVKNLSCRSPMLGVILDAFDIMYESKTCTVPKGCYSFEVNYNTVDHLWMPTREYGRLLRRIEATIKAGTVLCLDYEAIVEPETN